MRTGFPGDVACTVLRTALVLALASPDLGGAATAPQAPPPADAARPADPPPIAHRAGLIAVLPSRAEEADSKASLTGADSPLADPELAAALSTSSEGLYEEHLPEGAVMIRLQGRFRSVLFATVSPDGAVQRSHRQSSVAFRLDTGGEIQSCRPFEVAAAEVSHGTP